MPRVFEAVNIAEGLMSSVLHWTNSKGLKVNVECQLYNKALDIKIEFNMVHNDC